MRLFTAVIVPCYNEEKRLRSDAFLSFVSSNPNIQLWFANDGSTDGTLALVRGLEQQLPGQIYVFDLEKNAGKAEVLRQAFLHVQGLHKYSYIGFIDADLSAPLKEILPVLQQFDQNESLILSAGVRVKILGKDIERKPLRHYISRIFATFYNIILRMPNYDTQCGLKVFNAAYVPQVFGEQFISKWLFDIELFLRIQGIISRAEYEKRIREVPLFEWKEIGGSKLKFTDFLNAPLEVLKIRKRYIKIIKS